jgi:hypothetical protein
MRQNRAEEVLGRQFDGTVRHCTMARIAYFSSIQTHLDFIRPMIRQLGLQLKRVMRGRGMSQAHGLAASE